jgi:predicted metallo-beta-lactamase superfamily hydrolase
MSTEQADAERFEKARQYLRRLIIAHRAKRDDLYREGYLEVFREEAAICVALSEMATAMSRDTEDLHWLCGYEEQS